MPAAILRKQRLGELGERDASVLVDAFEWDWSASASGEPFVVVAVTNEVLERAAAVLRAHPLRIYDALQLGTALTARAADRELSSFACFDRRLAAAAEAEGFSLVS